MIDKGKTEAVLFDLDGTLMDTDDQAVERVARFLRWIHFPSPRRSARRLVMFCETPGNALLTMLDVLGLDVTVRAVSNRICDWRRARRTSFYPIMDDVDQMLIELGERYRLGVVTTRALCDADSFLKQHDLRDRFEVIVTSESTKRLKPHPAPVHRAAELLGVPTDACVMVGDTTVDVKSAVRAGAWAVAVLCGFGTRRELERAGAHVILESTSDLTSIL